MSLSETFAIFKASSNTSNILILWCYAVSLGTNPVPGGVIYVLLGLDKIVPSLLTTAIPILLALPSIPSARNYYI